MYDRIGLVGVTNAKDRAEEYRRNAEECRTQAAKALKSQDKAGWLKMAEDWLKLAQNVDAANRKQPSLALGSVGNVDEQARADHGKAEE